MPSHELSDVDEALKAAGAKAYNDGYHDGMRHAQENVESEIQCWREIVAHTARVIEAQCFDIPRLGKNRGEILHRVVEELRQAAVGDPEVVYAHKTRFFGRELQNLRDGGR